MSWETSHRPQRGIRVASPTLPGEEETTKELLQTLLLRVNSIHDEQIAFKDTISTWQVSVSEHAKSIELINDNLSKLSNKLDELLSENKVLTSKLSDCEVRLNQIEQEQLRNVVEIRGIPTSDVEVVDSLVIATGLSLGLKVDISDIDYAFRVGSRSVDHSSRAILVRFTRSRVAEEFVQLRKRKRNLYLKDLDVPHLKPYSLNPLIYVNESLTPLNRKLHSIARSLRKEGKIKFVWIRNGKVYVRKSEGADRVQVNTEEDLQRVK
ncbi:uncharacterized protein LOC124154308 [Ischnura elegans]|uniref:uncharacterized protein LOC124154308 n=1 Tax=Ischnura elegans TaxID=197161 RepID=UPI001ED87A54|nr:uncharacterized protein LOC124154308 [Ischnura elegans]